MRVCDICKEHDVLIKATIVVNDYGDLKDAELCSHCRRELKKREAQHRHTAYVETVKAMTGEIPRKAHWWDW